MNAEFITIIKEPHETAVMEALEALNEGRFDPDQGQPYPAGTQPQRLDQIHPPPPPTH